MTKPYDVVVFGASSFVGRLLVSYLWQRHGSKGEITWAMAGRSKNKLQSIQAQLGVDAQDIPLIVADAQNSTDLERLCSQATVVCTTVGPYAIYGDEVLKACVESGTHYCDLTGEIQWIDRMIQAYEATAKKTGAKIVHCCGFDSIPSDMGVYFLQQQAMAQTGKPCSQIRMRVRKAKGEFSGGTVASLINVTRELSANPGLAKKLGNPFLIAPSNPGTKQPNVKFAQFEADLNTWVAPFIMATINTRVVHRSNGLLKWAYGKHFKYDEAMMTGEGLKGRAMAVAISAALGGFLLGSALPPTRWFLEKFVVPKPGQGPSKEMQESGFYDLRFFGETVDGTKLVAKVTGDKDPGYGSTAKMLGEAAACIALNTKGKRGGFWTTSTLMGDTLLQRLQHHAGMTFEML